MYMSTAHTTEILKSLADDTRLAVVRKLASENCELAGSALIHGCSEALQLSQPTVSHHFARLVQSGVLLDRKAGTEKYYRLNTDLLHAIGIDPTKL
jgi:ArsR family transcriptional regulator, arsenate/arsenite/antimonite-responsive transcriptional repressor